MNWELFLNTVFEGTNVSLSQISIMQVYVPYLRNLAAALSVAPPTTVGMGTFNLGDGKCGNFGFYRGADVVVSGRCQRAPHHQVAAPDQAGLRRGRHLRSNGILSVNQLK